MRQRIEKQERSNKNKNGFSENINKIYKPFVRLTKKKERTHK
jgi:hypothetical protein